MFCNVYYPPHPIELRDLSHKSVFLAGTIDMGNSIDWQKEIEPPLLKLGYNIFNPRRSDWNVNWEQSIWCPEFVEQVDWELNALEQADYIIMRFEPNSISPISLLELGKFGHKMLVCCPKGYWRKGNIDIFCIRYAIPVFNTMEEIINELLLKNQ